MFTMPILRFVCFWVSCLWFCFCFVCVLLLFCCCLVLRFDYGIVTALQDSVAGPMPALRLGSPMRRES